MPNEIFEFLQTVRVRGQPLQISKDARRRPKDSRSFDRKPRGSRDFGRKPKGSRDFGKKPGRKRESFRK